MQIIIRPILEPQREIDMTHRLVAAIAEELWRLYGGNDQLNWMEAERHLARLVGGAPAGAAETEVVRAEPETVGEGACEPFLARQAAARRGRAGRRGRGESRPDAGAAGRARPGSRRGRSAAAMAA